jgi:hypothetical protein
VFRLIPLWLNKLKVFQLDAIIFGELAIIICEARKESDFQDVGTKIINPVPAKLGASQTSL